MFNKIIIIAIREYLSTIKSKSFILSIILVPILMSGSIIVMGLLGDHVDTKDKKIGIIDYTGRYAPKIISVANIRNSQKIFDKENNNKQVKPRYLFKIIKPDINNPQKQRFALSEQIRNSDLFSFVEIKEVKKDSLSVKYFAESSALDDIRKWIATPINYFSQSEKLKKYGIEQSIVDKLMQLTPIESMGLYTKNKETGEIIEAKKSSEGEAIAAPITMLLLMFVLTMLGAQPLLNSTMEEKNQKIAEVLLGSCNTFEFMMGKIIGGVAVALSALFIYTLVGVVSLKYMHMDSFIPYKLLPWFAGYTVILITMMGAIFAALGSACNNHKEAQTFAFPGMFPIMIPMFVWLIVVKEPLSTFATTMSLIPPFTPILMLLRQSTPYTIPVWQPIVGVAGVSVFTIFIVWIGSRIFRVGILMQGQSPKFKTLIGWVFKNN